MMLLQLAQLNWLCNRMLGRPPPSLHERLVPKQCPICKQSCIVLMYTHDIVGKQIGINIMHAALLPANKLPKQPMLSMLCADIQSLSIRWSLEGHAPNKLRHCNGRSLPTLWLSRKSDVLAGTSDA